MDAYERIRILGKGSYGQAWLVRDRTTKELCVMKDMQPRNDQELTEAVRCRRARPPHTLSLSSLKLVGSRGVAQQLAEAQLLKAISHPHVVKFRDVLRSGKRDVHLVMEFAAGGDLADLIEKTRLKGTRLSQEQVVGWLAQLVSALREIHSHGMLHRDIKTANIFLTERAEAIKLGDFGCARDHPANCPQF